MLNDAYLVDKIGRDKRSKAANDENSELKKIKLFTR